ncbi:MAG: GNAT family N-acetyltransferase [Lachnospiraceae bacterium]|nr:GNAT family N-acetyltransferase [Lachnospiraceae bacterium]
MNRAIYATDGIYFLSPFEEEDRNIYMDLQKKMEKKLTAYEKYCEDSWWYYKLHGETKSYFIISMEGVYCGYIELIKYAEDTPEIGIELTREKRNQGIAKHAVNMLIKRVCQERNIPYFIIHIAENNAHSRHVFEKMGAVFVESEQTNYEKYIKICKTEKERKNVEIFFGDEIPICRYLLRADQKHIVDNSEK